MTSEQSQEVKGTFFRGAEGALYFIPDEDIEGYRVPQEQTDQAQQMLDAQGGDVEGFYHYSATLSPIASVQFSPTVTVRAYCYSWLSMPSSRPSSF